MLLPGRAAAQLPSGALIGCAAGFVSVPRVKGVHNVMGSSMLAAEHAATALDAGRANDELVESRTRGANPS